MSRPGDSCEYKPHRQLLVDLLCPEEEAWQFLSIYADITRTVLHNPHQNWPHVDNDGFAEGKCEWMKLFPGRLNVTQTAQVDLWGNEEDLFVSRLILLWRQHTPATANHAIVQLEPRELQHSCTFI